MIALGGGLLGIVLGVLLGQLITLAVGTFWAWQERRIAAMGSDKARPPRL